MPAFSFYAVCPFGLEALLADEIRALGADPDLVKPGRGGVQFAGDTGLAMAACLHSQMRL